MMIEFLGDLSTIVLLNVLFLLYPLDDVISSLITYLNYIIMYV